MPHPSPRLRWWPAALVLAAAATAVLWLQLDGDLDQQDANVKSVAVGLLAGALLLLWALLLSGLRVRHRLWLAGGPLLVLVAFFACFRLHGFTGDLLPIFVLRGTDAAPIAADLAADPAPTDRAAKDTQAPADAADFAQFFGPNRDGTLAGPTLETDWETAPPQELWRHPVGTAWSGFAVSGAYAITQEQHGAQEATVAYHLTSGEVLWVHRQDGFFESTVAGNGPRATPTISGDDVFVLGSTGNLTALDLRTGAQRWTTNILEDADAPLPEWGVAGSPLVHGDEVIVNPGGAGRSIVAYDRAAGSERWSSGDDSAQWSAPVAATLLGEEQILMFGNYGVVAHRPGGGVLWQYPWKGAHPHVCMPVPIGGDRVFISSGYGTGCHLVQLARGADGTATATMIWRTLSLKSKFANATVRRDSIYGLDDGRLVCVDLVDGKRRWRGERFGHGQILWVGDLLLVTAESGEVVLLAPDEQGPNERARLSVFDDKTWNPPAVAGAYLLVRNDREAVCLRLPTKP